MNCFQGRWTWKSMKAFRKCWWVVLVISAYRALPRRELFLPSFFLFLKIPSKIPDFAGSQTAWSGRHRYWKNTNWCQQWSILLPCGCFCFKWVSIFGTGWRVFIAPVFLRSDTMPGMWFGQWGTCLMKCCTFPGPGRFFSHDIFPVAPPLHSIIMIHLPNSWAWHM